MYNILNDKKAVGVFVLPAFLLFLLIVIVPIAISGYYSLLEWNGIGKSQVFTGITNYVNLLFKNNDGFVKSIVNSFVLVLCSVFIQLPIALLLAILLSNGIKGEGFFRTIYFVPVVLAVIVIGQLWRRIYNPNQGLLNSVLMGLGFAGAKNKAWLGDVNTALFAVFAPITWQWIGYHMLLMYAAAKSVPTEVREAAIIDGAGDFAIACKIIIPLIKPVLKVCVVFAVIGSLKSFDLIYILTNGGPAHATEVPSTLMLKTIFSKGLYGYGSSMAIFILIECLAFTVLIQKFFKVEEITY